MSITSVIVSCWEFNRGRTLATLAAIEKLASPSQALLWRPGVGRAHIGWQLMHVAVTEDISATERMSPQRQPKFADLWPRFRGGSTPDDAPLSVAELREALSVSRANLLETMQEYSDARLEEIPPALAERKINVHTYLQILAWHEAHHQGQAHLTLNLFKAAHGGA